MVWHSERNNDINPDAILERADLCLKHCKKNKDVRDLTITTEGYDPDQKHLDVNPSIVERALQENPKDWFYPEELQKLHQGRRKRIEALFSKGEIKNFKLKGNPTNERKLEIEDVVKRHFVVPESLDPKNLSENELIRLCLMFKIRNAISILGAEKKHRKKISPQELIYTIAPQDITRYGSTLYGVKGTYSAKG